MATTRNRRESGRFSDLVRSVDKVMNPRVTCGFSRETDETTHAPVGISDPFTSSFSEKKLDNDAQVA